MHTYICILTIYCGVGGIETPPFHISVCDKFHCQEVTGRKKRSWHHRSTECANYIGIFIISIIKLKEAKYISH